MVTILVSLHFDCLIRASNSNEADTPVVINPTEGMAAELDPEDVILLAPVSATAPVNGSDRPGPPAPTEVSWMRTSNLFMRKMQNKRRDAADKAKSVYSMCSADISHENEVDASEAAQVLAIEQSFEDITKQDPTQIRHPDAKKRKLEVIEVCMCFCLIAHGTRATIYSRMITGERYHMS